MCYNCFNCIYAEPDYDDDGYTPLIKCKVSGYSGTWPMMASDTRCKYHIQGKRICISWDDVFRYTANMLSDKFHKYMEGIGRNSRLSEFPISPGRLAFDLADTYAVTIPEERYSTWQTVEQAVNTVFSLLASNGERLK